MDDPKFSAFNVNTTSYKIVNGQEIPLWVIIPKGVHTGKRPVLVHFHGGFLMTGHAIYPDWTAQWSLDYATRHSAIRVSANYRLLPESNGLDILSDVEDVFKWVENKLPAFLKTIGSDVTPDYEKVAAYGESAGGYLAIQSGLIRPDLVKAVIGAYPVTYLDSPWYSEVLATKAPFGAPQLPSVILDGHLASMSPGKIVTGAFPQDRVPLGIVTLQQGRFPEFLGADESLYLAKVLAKKTSSDKAPFLYVLHGTDDSAVPASETEKFLGAWKEKFGDDSAIGKFEKGEHGFDGEASLETPWMKDGLVGVTKAWIG